jgi:hypothetical protein
MTAPTEAEIRAEIGECWQGPSDPSTPNTPHGTLSELIARVADPFIDSAARTLEVEGGSVWEPLLEDVGPLAIWTDLRPSQAVRLVQLVGAAQDRATARCEAIIIEELTAVGLTFAAEHPDAPRVQQLSASADRP